MTGIRHRAGLARESTTIRHIFAGINLRIEPSADTLLGDYYGRPVIFALVRFESRGRWAVGVVTTRRFSNEKCFAT